MATKKAKKKAAKKPPKKTTAAKRRVAAARPGTTARAGARKTAKKARRAQAAKPAKKAAPRQAAKKAAPRQAAKKAAPRKAAKKLARGGVRKAPVRRRDHAGHIDPKYGAELIAKSGGHEVDPRSFVERPRANDDLVEELGEEFVEEATSAEHEGEDLLNQDVPEEKGGPFVETTADQEFAHGTDPSNPRGAKREPFPTT